MLQDLDNSEPKKEIPVDLISDELLFKQGRIKDLFDRVKDRSYSVYDAVTKTRPKSYRIIAEVKDRENLKEYWKLIERDSLAHFVQDEIECFIVRYGHEKYAFEVFVMGQSVGSFLKRDFKGVIDYLFDKYPDKSDRVLANVPMVPTADLPEAKISSPKISSPKRSGGRPKGSKNKKKITESTTSLE